MTEIFDEDVPVEIIELPNRLLLQIYDRSQRLAGDRWNVVLVANIDVDVAEQARDATQARAWLDALGETVTYDQERKRVFVDEEEKANVWASLRQTFLESQLLYISRRDFARRLIQRQLHRADRAA